MCLDFPHKISNLKGDLGEVICPKNGGIEEVKINLIPGVKIGDYVLAQSGYAVAIIPEAEAKETLKVLKNAKKS